MANGQLPSDSDPPPAMWNTLHSRPGSSRTIYLDFTGCQVPAAGAWGAVQQPPFDLDNNINSFSAGEQTAMIQIWRAVAADFHDLDVDVTTEPTTLAKLFRASTSDTEYGMRTCIGGLIPGFLDGLTGGVAYVDIFADTNYNGSPFSSSNWGYQPAFVFVPGMGYNPVGIALATSHELGHTLVGRVQLNLFSEHAQDSAP
eukprot:gene4560-4812_t